MANHDRPRGWQEDRGSYRGRDRGFGQGRYPSEERDYGRRDYGRFYEEEGDNGDFRQGYGRGLAEDPYRGGYSQEAYRSGYGQEGYRGDRGFFERAGDEIATWFGSDDAERRRRQDAREGDTGAQHHRGKGPKGYVRSDERIREDVQDRLTDDPYLDATEIEVVVANGEVTLNGTVNSPDDKRHAEDIVDRVSGVKHVQNNLRVQQHSATGERARVY
ncbi:BON domain-containing protein [Geminicoccus harenae]|uniref:BON domain-containing protein n=1 Tax=Geminicoccus harenae TaxID=2498453 RepID=UPI00168A4290|nr:BON domain-containing protein [Geminicoccus harenae]